MNLQASGSRESIVNATLAELSRALIQQMSIEEISQRVLEYSKSLTGSIFGFVGYIDPHSGYLISPTLTRDVWGECQIPDKSIVFEKFGGLWGWVLENRQPLLTNSPAEDPRSTGIPAGHISIHRFLSVPALIGETLVGQIALANADHDYSEQDLALVERLAALYAFAVHREQTEEKIKEYAENLEKMVDERTSALKESDERYRGLYESSIDGIVSTDLEGNLVECNQAYADMLGYTKEEVYTLTYQELTPSKWHEMETQIVTEQILQRGYSEEYEKEYIRKDGTIFPISERVWHIKDKEGNLTGMWGVIRDITERKQTEDALRDSKRELDIRNKIANIFLTVPDDEMYGEVLKVLLDAMNSVYGVFGYIDEEGAFVVPSMTRHIWDKCQVPDKTFVFPRENWGHTTWPEAIRQKKTIYSNEPSTATPEGHIVISRHISLPIIHHEAVVGLIQVANKETDYDDASIKLLETISAHIAPVLAARLQRDRQEEERKNVQEELARKEKMFVLGKLAGGVAHELRNPLSAIKNATYFLNMSLEEPVPEIKETLEILKNEIISSERIIDSIINFTHPKSPIRRIVNINAVIKDVLNRQNLKESTEVLYKLDEPISTILADPDQLGQVFENIILNATQSMPEGGRLTIKSETLGPDFVTISFSDTGIGIPEENLTKLFEPLFTTKAKGIGLGLAITNNLVEGHGGTIEVQSKVGKGTTFTVKLPTAEIDE